MRFLFMLSIRQLAGRWRLLIILVLAVLPIVMSVTRPDDAPQSEIDDFLVNGLLAAAILPIVTLAVATAAFGNEVEDRTLSYLVLNPIARWQIVLPKLLAAISVSAPVLLVSGIVSTFLAFEGDVAATSAVALALLVGVALYASVFVWAGLLSSRALAFGLVYVFLWEGLFASYVDGIRYLSIREYTIGLMRGFDPDRFSGPGQSTIEFPAAIGGAAIVFTVFFLLTVRRLRTMDVP